MTPAEVERQVREEIATQLLGLARGLVDAATQDYGSRGQQTAEAAWHAFTTSAVIARGPVVAREAEAAQDDGESGQ